MNNVRFQVSYSKEILTNSFPHGIWTHEDKHMKMESVFIFVHATDLGNKAIYINCCGFQICSTVWDIKSRKEWHDPRNQVMKSTTKIIIIKKKGRIFISGWVYHNGYWMNMWMVCRIKAQLFLFPSVQLLGKKTLCYLKGFPFMLVGHV